MRRNIQLKRTHEKNLKIRQCLPPKRYYVLLYRAQVQMLLCGEQVRSSNVLCVYHAGAFNFFHI